MHIVLIEPEIPANTGNVARLCAATGFALHLVKPFGFVIDDKHLKRAGLDYWHLIKIFYHDSFDELFEKYSHEGNFYFFSKKAEKNFQEISYQENDFLVFGKETKGLPDEMLERFEKNCVRIPMREGTRCLNLSNAVAVASYEALRQLNYHFEN